MSNSKCGNLHTSTNRKTCAREQKINIFRKVLFPCRPNTLTLQLSLSLVVRYGCKVAARRLLIYSHSCILQLKCVLPMLRYEFKYECPHVNPNLNKLTNTQSNSVYFCKMRANIIFVLSQQ